MTHSVIAKHPKEQKEISNYCLCGTKQHCNLPVTSNHFIMCGAENWNTKQSICTLRAKLNIVFVQFDVKKDSV